MGKDTDLELKRGVVGYIGANGRRVLRDGMVCANRIPRRPSTRARGPMDCKTAMDQRHMRMKVKMTSVLNMSFAQLKTYNLSILVKINLRWNRCLKTTNCYSNIYADSCYFWSRVFLFNLETKNLLLTSGQSGWAH